MAEREELQAILQEYGEAVQGVEKSKRPFDGVLGLGRHPAGDPCHGVLEDRVAALMTRAAAEELSPEALDGLISDLMRAGREYEGPGYARLALVAIQRHGLPLIPRMSPEGRRELRAWYETAYPKRQRFPIQKTILEALERA